MAKFEKYQQCILSRAIASGEMRTTMWLPAKFAVGGGIIRMQSESGVTEEWRVDHVDPQSFGLFPDSHGAIKGHKTRTGDSLPKKQKK